MSSELQRASLFFRYIREEHTHHQTILEQGKSEMLSALKHVRVDPNASRPPPQQAPPPPPAPEPPPDDAKEPETAAPEIKKLYRKIVQETHPDKIAGMGLGQKEFERRSTLYKRAVEAFRGADEDILIEAAVDLDIETGLDEERVASSLRKRASLLEKSIKSIKASVEWYWVHAPESEKIRVVKEICTRNGWLYITDEQIAESVRYAVGMHPGTRDDVRRRARQQLQERRKAT